MCICKQLAFLQRFQHGRLWQADVLVSLTDHQVFVSALMLQYKVLPCAVVQDIGRQDAQEAAQHTPAAEPAAAAPQQEASSEAEAQQPASSSGVAGEVPAGHSGAEQGQPAHFVPPVSASGAPQAHLGLPAASSAPFQMAPVGMQPGFGPRMLAPHGRPLRPMPFLGMLPMRPGEASRGRGCHSAAV